MNATILGSGERVTIEDVSSNDPASADVLLNDSLQHVGGTRAVPDPVGVDHRDRTVATNSKTTHLGALHIGVLASEIQLDQSALKLLPRLEALLRRATLRFRLLRAEKYMPLDPIKAWTLHRWL